MKKLFTLCALMLLGGSLVYSQLLTENFDYTAGDSLTAHGWTQHSAGTTYPEIFVTSPGLVYTGYAGSGVGNAASLGAGTGQDVNKPFSEQTSGAVFGAIMVNITSASIGGDYFFHFSPTDLSLNVFRGRLHVKRDASNNVAFGISFKGTNPVYTGFDYAFGTTYLLVVKCEFGQNAKLFINPTIGGAEPSATVTSTDFDSDPVNYGAIALRQGGGSTAAAVTVDGIRVATTWADAVTGGGSTANQPPAISGLTRDPYIPVNEALVGATVTDDHIVTDVKLYYTANSTTDSMTMDPTGADTYEAEIPAKPNGTYVTYFIKAVDDSGAVTIGSTQKYLGGTTTISAIRVNDGNGLNTYIGTPVRVRGIVTAGDTLFTGFNTDIFIQDATGGVNIYKSGLTLYPDGQDLTVEGTINHFNGKLEITTPNMTITDNGAGAMPAPVVLAPGDAFNESNEGLLAVITGVDFDASGTFVADDSAYTFNSTSNYLIYVDKDNENIVGQSIPGTVVNVQGIMSQYKSGSPYTSGYQLIPRYASDLNYTISVKNDELINPKAFSLGQNFPNPFNPTTMITYEVPKASDISVKVYNLLGQEIRTLFSGKQNAGKHAIQWDGRDNAGRAVSTGIYFYRLNAPNFVQTRKMIMIK